MTNPKTANELIQEVARRLCMEDGRNPDERTFYMLGTDTYPLWDDYIDEAVQEIKNDKL